METEIRFYYSLESEEKIINNLKKIKELEYDDKYYEVTEQYNHPMKKYNFYTKEIDGRFRIRKTQSDNISKCMITWKKRLPNSDNQIHEEEEVEVSINIDEYDKLIYLLNNVLHMKLVEKYERYRTIFHNEDIEIAVDKYPFGIALEIENKSKNKNPKEVVEYWINKIGLNIKDSYPLSWDDKYTELCKEQNMKVENIVTFDKDMPKENNKFML